MGTIYAISFHYWALGFGFATPVGFRSWHDGFDFGAPGIQPVRQVPDLVRVRRGQIVLFARIVAQVVQLASLVFVPFDQFPVAVSNEPAGAPPWLP